MFVLRWVTTKMKTCEEATNYKLAVNYFKLFACPMVFSHLIDVFFETQWHSRSISAVFSKLQHSLVMPLRYQCLWMIYFLQQAMQGPAMEVEWLVYMTMLIGKVYLVKPAIIIKPEMEGARHSISVAHAPGSESAMLLPTTQSGRSAIMVRGRAD